MGTAIWIIIALVTAAAGYMAAMNISKKNASSKANSIIDEANRQADVIKEKKILKAKEEEMKIISDAERTANQRLQKVQTSEARAKQREIQLNQQQNELSRRKKNLTRSRIISTTARLCLKPARTSLST